MQNLGPCTVIKSVLLQVQVSVTVSFQEHKYMILSSNKRALFSLIFFFRIANFLMFFADAPVPKKL